MALLIASRDPATAQLDVRRMLDKKYPGNGNAALHDFQQGILDRLVGDRMMAQAVRFLRLPRRSAGGGGTAWSPLLLSCAAPGEIGIRMALGASRGRVVASMLRRACVMLAAGLAGGTVLAVLAGREASTCLRPQAVGPDGSRRRRRAARTRHPVGQPGSILARANVNPIDSLRGE